MLFPGGSRAGDNTPSGKMGHSIALARQENAFDPSQMAPKIAGNWICWHIEPKAVEKPMKVSDKLGDLYGDYYDLGGSLAQKRKVTARQTIGHIKTLLPDPPYGRLLDIGAGEGSVLEELDIAAFAEELHAVEISLSGIETIKRRNIPRVKSVSQFDGYKIDVPDKTYDLGTAIHVLEHVEHERAFIEEITRACEIVYIEVPLELTARVDRSIELSGPFGHINFYNPSTLRNLLKTCNVEILAFQVFPHSRAYETHVAGNFVGNIKYGLRSSLLAFIPGAATFAMSYLAGAVCRRS